MNPVASLLRAHQTHRHSANPGTTADLIAATLFVLLLEGGWAAGPYRLKP